MTVNLLVQMVSMLCMRLDYDGGVTRKGVHILNKESIEEYRLDCFDHFNNCMVGPDGVIKASSWKGCKKSWEKKNAPK